MILNWYFYTISGRPENDGIFETRNLSEELLAVDAAIVRMDREVTQLQEEVSQLGELALVAMAALWSNDTSVLPPHN